MYYNFRNLDEAKPLNLCASRYSKLRLHDRKYLGHIYYMSGTIPCFIIVNYFNTETPMKYVLLHLYQMKKLRHTATCQRSTKLGRRTRDSDPDICSDLFAFNFHAEIIDARH